MVSHLQKMSFLLTIVVALNAATGLIPFDQAFASNQPKKAKWQAPEKASKKKSKQKKSFVNKSKESNNKPNRAKPQPTKKTELKKTNKKGANKKAETKKAVPKRKASPLKVPEENSLIINQDSPFDDSSISEKRSSSPLLIVFVLFVLCCVGGMLFLSNRRKQVELAKMNFQEASNHELASSSNQERLISRHPTHSDHEPVTTKALFERTDKKKAYSKDSTPNRLGFLGIISSKAAGLVKAGKGKSRSELRGKSKELLDQYNNDNFNSGSITSIGAVKSKKAKQRSQPSGSFNPESTLDQIAEPQSPEPCSIEIYIEIQVAAQCWRAQNLSLDTKLRETFDIDTNALIQYEFYWKQKISNNVNLKKKYQELEPLYLSKYESAS